MLVLELHVFKEEQSPARPAPHGASGAVLLLTRARQSSRSKARTVWSAFQGRRLAKTEDGAELG